MTPSLSFVLTAIGSLFATATATSQIIPIAEDSGFWFGNFTIGNTTNLSLLIDTGSGDIIVNPGSYKPGPSSQNLNEKFDNGYGTTQSNGGGSVEITGPLYSDIVAIGNISARQPVGVPTEPTGIPHDGIVGFAPDSVQFPGANATAYVDTLCQDGKLSECRFGLALNSNQTGSLILGELASSLYQGTLATAPLLQTWAVYADIYLNGSSLVKDAPVLMDSGTATITGPIEAVQSIFNATGITGIQNGSTLFGYFPCDKPPTLGIGLPSQTIAAAAAKNGSTTVSRTSTVFDVRLDQWAIADNGNNNCTAVLSGQDITDMKGLWIFGQAFFTGLYVDHNLKGSVMSFANLSASSSSSSSPNATSTASSSASSTSSAASATKTSAGNAVAPVNWMLSGYAMAAILTSITSQW